MKTQFLKILLCGIFGGLLLCGKSNAQYMVNGKEVDTTFNSAKILKSAQNEHGAPDVTISTADMADGNYFLYIIQGSSVIEKQVMVRH